MLLLWHFLVTGFCCFILQESQGSVLLQSPVCASLCVCKFACVQLKGTSELGVGWVQKLRSRILGACRKESGGNQ